MTTTGPTAVRGTGPDAGPVPRGLWLRRLAWASLVANIGIVVTGGAVRLTGSGLGCPTWPRCTDESFTPHGAYSAHSIVEFGNRTLTFVLVAVAVATFVAAWRSGRRELRRYALVLALGVPAQAVIGGVSVLTGLNPWVVSLHLLLSMAMVGVAVLLRWRLDRPVEAVAVAGVPGVADVADVPEGRGGRALRGLALSTFAAAWAVLAVGTVVTGSGPHAGDASAPRNGLSPLQLSQAHADLVFLLFGLTLGLLLACHAVGAAPAVRRVVLVLLLVELGQGLIGFVQYFTDLPIVLVGFHLLGASLVSAAVTWTVLAVREGSRDEVPAG